MEPITNAPIIKPHKLDVIYEHVDDQIRLRAAPRQWVGTLFLCFWLTGWTVGCAALAWQLFTNFQWFMLLFSIPFFAAEVFVACFLLSMFFFREELTLTTNGARYQAWIIVPIKDMRYDLAQLQKFVVKETSDSESTSHSLLLETTGISLTLCADLPLHQITWLVYELNQQLARFKGVESVTDTITLTSSDLEVADEAPLELRPSVDAVVQRPDDSRWSKTTDFDEFRFHERGQITLSGLGGLLFINLFWNGIVSVFVCVLLGLAPDMQKQPQGSEWWFLFFFLIPFEIIGLSMFVGLWIYLIEPFRTSSWVFFRNRIEYRRRWLGLGPTWRYDIQELDRLELHANQAAQKVKRKMKVSTANLEGRSYCLKIIDKKMQPICVLDSLTLAEACWLANEILTERKGWFT